MPANDVCPRALLTTSAVVLLGTTAVGQQIRRVDLAPDGSQATTGASVPAIDADGGLVAFEFSDSNLVPGDVNGFLDVALVDRATGAIELVSVAADGGPSNGNSYDPWMSSDGRYVCFESDASNLVSGDANHHTDVFVRDRVLGTTTRVSVADDGSESNGDSRYGRISKDGSVVAFESFATNLVTGDTNGVLDVFVRDLNSGHTTRMSVDSSGNQGNGASYNPGISGDGNVVAFYSSATNLIARDTNRLDDCFVHNRTTGETKRVSVTSAGLQASKESSSGSSPAISGDGNLVAFESLANLTGGDTNGSGDVYLRDVAAAKTERISVTWDGKQGDADAQDPSISDDGTRVLFMSTSALFVKNSNGLRNVYLRDRTASTTTLASEGCSLVLEDGNSFGAQISLDGTVATFYCFATNLVPNDTNGVADVFTNDLDFVPDAASWWNYGAGWPGTSGVPALTSSAAPVLGTSFDLVVGNSLGDDTLACLLVGTESDDVPTARGGTEWVGGSLYGVLVTLTPGTNFLAVDVPADDLLCNLTFYVQGLELDDGASKGLSFSPGLALHIGQ